MATSVRNHIAPAGGDSEGLFVCIEGQDPVYYDRIGRFRVVVSAIQCDARPAQAGGATLDLVIVIEQQTRTETKTVSSEGVIVHGNACSCEVKLAIQAKPASIDITITYRVPEKVAGTSQI